MKHLTTVTMFVLALSCSPMAGNAGSITISTSVPASGTPAGVHNPGCAGGVTKGDDIIELMRKGAEINGYGQVANEIAKNNWARNRLKVMLGIHSGPSVCRVFCGAVPSTPSSYNMCVDGNCRSKNHNSKDFAFVDFDAWAVLQEWADSNVGSDRVVCFLAKNWKHDQSRSFSVRIHY